MPTRLFQPGQSGNPNGRPKGFGSLIREESRDGAELVEFAFAILRGKRKADLKMKFQALEWLADRGWGKAVQTTELGVADGIGLKGYIEVSPSDWPAKPPE